MFSSKPGMIRGGWNDPLAVSTWAVLFAVIGKSGPAGLANPEKLFGFFRFTGRGAKLDKIAGFRKLLTPITLDRADCMDNTSPYEHCSGVSMEQCQASFCLDGLSQPETVCGICELLLTTDP